MLFLLILIAVVASSALIYLYFNRASVLELKLKIVLYSLWLVIFIVTMLVCSNLAHIGLVFNSHAPDYDFMQTVDSDYISLFITNWLYILVGIGIYFTITRKLKIAPLWFLVVLFMLVVYLYYPGIPSADGIDTSYSQFLAQSYTDFQPPLFTLWWHIFRIKSAAFIMNSLFYYGGLIYISYFLRKNGKHWQNDLLVLFCLNPLMFTQLAIIWKDISFTGFLIDCVALYLAIPSILNRKIKILAWAAYFLCLFLAIGFRFNGAIAVLPFMLIGVYKALLPVIYQQRWQLKALSVSLISLGVISCFVMVNLFIVYKVFDAKATNVQGAVMLSNMASIECMSNHEYKINVNYFTPPVDDSRNIFCDQVINYYNNDAQFANWSGTGVMLNWSGTDEDYKEIKQQWISALVDYPMTYLLYRAEYFTNVMFFSYWYPTGTLTETPDLMSKIATSQHADMKIELALFLIAGTIAGLFACVYFKIYGLSLVILISSILQLLSLYFLIPNHSARYFFWDYIAVVLALAFLTLEKPSVKMTSNSKLRKKYKHTKN